MDLVLLIDEDGSKIGKISLDKAKNIASEKKLDLIEVNADNRVFRLGDLGKINYNKKQEKRKQRAQKKNQKIKEIQVRPTTDVGDWAVKMRKVREFLSSGHKTKFVMKFKRSQMGYQNIGVQKIQDMIAQFTSEGLIGDTDSLKKSGNSIMVLLNPQK